ncbi:hypothetical protein [Methyloceanibacter sp.]|jgi:hypothetical protein|uniref:hypothetical protein n=1 Tax=Methyloceanibacter sp. TaxID=1965321 RepID=UPI00356A85E2
MKKFAFLSIAIGALAFMVVSLVPQPADAGWRRKAWRQGYYAPNVYVAPRGGYYVPRCGYTYRYRRCGGAGYPYAYYPYWRGRYQRGWYR